MRIRKAVSSGQVGESAPAGLEVSLACVKVSLDRPSQGCTAELIAEVDVWETLCWPCGRVTANAPASSGLGCLLLAPQVLLSLPGPCFSRLQLATGAGDTPHLTSSMARAPTARDRRCGISCLDHEGVWGAAGMLGSQRVEGLTQWSCQLVRTCFHVWPCCSLWTEYPAALAQSHLVLQPYMSPDLSHFPFPTGALRLLREPCFPTVVFLSGPHLQAEP